MRFRVDASIPIVDDVMWCDLWIIDGIDSEAGVNHVEGRRDGRLVFAMPFLGSCVRECPRW